MNKNIETMEVSKRDLLINSGFKEFCKMGEKRASLNTILKNAKMAKGTFYHYFESKEGFYLYLADQAIDLVIEKFVKEDLLAETDYIKRLRLSAIYKLDIMEKYPALFDFLAFYYSTMTPEEYFALINKKGDNFVQNFLYEGIDFSLFNEEIPPELVIKLVGRYNNQILTEIVARKDLVTFKEKIDYYTKELDEIKDIFYKKGV